MVGTNKPNIILGKRILKVILITIVILGGIAFKSWCDHFPAVFLAVIASLLLWNDRGCYSEGNGWNIENIRRDLLIQHRMENGWMYLVMLLPDLYWLRSKFPAELALMMLVLMLASAVGAIVLGISYFRRLSHAKHGELLITQDRITSKRIKQMEETHDLYYITYANEQHEWESPVSQAIYEKVAIGDATQSVWLPGRKRPTLVNYSSCSAWRSKE